MSSNLVRWSGLAATVGGVLGIVLTPPFALAYISAFEGGYAALTFRSNLIDAPYPLDFSYGERVYYTYGRLYFLTLLPELLALYVLRRLRGGDSGALERWGFRLSLVGMWLVVIGVFTDYWMDMPPGFWAVIVATPFFGAGFVLLGVGWQKAGVVPLWVTLVMVGAAIGTSPVMFFLVLHWPSGPLLLLHLTCVALGYVLWSGQGDLTVQPSRVG
jgi:hypothetical protein